MLVELLIATALGALTLASAMQVRKRLGRSGPSDLREAMKSQAKHLRRVMRMPSRGRDRPRVVVQGPKVKPVVCQICLGRVKEGLEYAKCPCGKVFHTICLTRTGFCPYCNLQYEEGSLDPEIIVRPKITPQEAARRKADVRMLWEPTARRACPICGSELPADGNECECGAIVVEEGESFNCPSCGTMVPADRMSCPACKESFEAVSGPQCPVCGRLLRPGEEVCQCGGLAGEECPECGSPLGPEDELCPSCGTAFEFV
ncbi:MAG: double zinc ribbon domain-containing protein [Methanomassiliicoccales archaeon]|nr:double zinc ribbon domain-containing protein [Methanomassiliicoccales archaeon]MDD1757004.1 double zinc ribbon domain-containing protein [Methanomassiliicoccales archaeon]